MPWTPLAHFYADGASVAAMRLSVSAVTPEQIDLGLDRLAALITDEPCAAGTLVSPGAVP